MGSPSLLGDPSPWLFCRIDGSCSLNGGLHGVWRQLKIRLFTFMSGEPVFGGLRGTDPVLRDRSKLHWQTALCFGIHAHEL